ncbi:ribosomal L1 domain-containing protein CG13096-like [Anticarsia gemmatalis]|uniref:ribosomal L1 domain-containing protein CG13096-like n=1 Tax=Anticarsia gemmatalis TaxID=129554 RepID=UPI003F75A57D
MVSAKKNVPPKKRNNIQKSAKVGKLKTKKPKTAQIVQAVTESPKTAKQVKPNIETKVSPNKKVKYTMPSKAITEDLVDSCLSALIDIAVCDQEKHKNFIFEDDKPIFAEIHCMKIQNTRGNIKFLLPNSTISSTGEVCLVTPDIKKGRKHDHEPTIDRWEEILRKAGVTQVKTILPVRQLRVEYDQFELKRRLLTQHDFIMVDTRVLNHVSHLMGKMFFKKHNMLIPVRMDEEKDVKKYIDIGLRTAVMRLNEGETATITVGHSSMSRDKIKENIMALVQQLKTKYPGGEANIRAISIKLPLSISLPIYLTLRPSSTVRPPKLTQKRPKHYTVLEDDLSTRPGHKVRVAPDGNVQLAKPKKIQKVRTIKEDEEKSDEENENDGSESEEEAESDASE